MDDKQRNFPEGTVQVLDGLIINYIQWEMKAMGQLFAAC